MRFRLELTLTDPARKTLPINYQYELSSWIYQVIHHGDPYFSEWLHEHGYSDNLKKFRLFTFSNLIIPEKTVHNDRIRILSSQVSLIVSFLPDEAITPFINGLFQSREFTLGDRQSHVNFRVAGVEGLPEPGFTTTMKFTLLSPMLLSLRLPEEKYARYLAPDFPDYGEMVIKNLTEKWKVFTRRPPPEIDKVTFSLLSPARKKGILIKAGTNMESKLIGYIFSFAISGPPELLRLGYYTGFGEKNSMGFGCTETRQ